ncbi:MAG: hypothetical protein N2042_00870 [Thermodesulfovibrio sp.]|nr:hypothetical protein [Thermodesulfovibrio sp.]MDW7972814.1 hypothetical protein [Thermodesulfovibrio sp.]
MNTKTLSMILKLKEWEEELEKQKFAKIISERQKMQIYIKELEERLNSGFYLGPIYNQKELIFVYDGINYLIEKLREAEEIIKKMDEEIDKQRQIYEQAFKERKKIEQLYERVIDKIKREKEKSEEKLLSDLFITRLGSK